MKWILSTLLIGVFILLYIDRTRELSPWEKKFYAESAEAMSRIASAANTLSNWPPKVGENFPSVPLIDHTGQQFDISSLGGKPTLIEFVAMTCAGCQGFSGGNKFGGYQGFAVQADLPSVEELLSTYGGFDLFSPQINFVQIVIYNLDLEAPRATDLQGWRDHFQFNTRANTKILGGSAALANKDSYRMIPGFMLLDSNGTVCYDGTGHNPQHNPYSVVMAEVASVVENGRCL